MVSSRERTTPSNFFWSYPAAFAMSRWFVSALCWTIQPVLGRSLPLMGSDCSQLCVPAIFIDSLCALFRFPFPVSCLVRPSEALCQHTQHLRIANQRRIHVNGHATPHISIKNGSEVQSRFAFASSGRNVTEPESLQVESPIDVACPGAFQYPEYSRSNSRRHAPQFRCRHS